MELECTSNNCKAHIYIIYLNIVLKFVRDRNFPPSFGPVSNIQTNPSKLSMSWYFLFGSELRLDCSNPLSEPHFMV